MEFLYTISTENGAKVVLRLLGAQGTSRGGADTSEFKRFVDTYWLLFLPIVAMAASRRMGGAARPMHAQNFGGGCLYFPAEAGK